MFRKIILSIVTALILFQSSVALAFAAPPQPATWYNQGLQEWYLKVYDTSVSPPQDIFGERYTAAQVDWIIWSVITWLPTKILNPDGTACLIGLFNQIFSGGGFDINNCKNKIFGSAFSQPIYAQVPKQPNQTLFQAVFESNRPLSGITYVKNLVNKVTGVPVAHAQGFGYTNALEPFRTMWATSRDIAYSLFVFAAIILAFMVMFRVKLSPQNAVTVQSAIPKLIISLILVTFSYAIAGFLVDLMYVTIGLVSIIGARFISPNINPKFVYDFLTIGPNITLPVIGQVGLGIFGMFFAYLVLFALTFIIVGITYFGVAGAAVTAILTAIGVGLIIASGGTLALIALLIFFILFLIIAIIVIIMIFKTIWAIVQAFANIILLTIFAPFQLLLGTFVPSMGFGSWVKSYISNLGVFVGVGFLFLLATIFLFQAVGNALTLFSPAVGQNAFQQLLTAFFGSSAGAVLQGQATPGWPPLLNYGLLVNSAATASLFYMTFSFVIFFQIPKVADMIKSFISGRPWSYGSALGEGLAAGGLIGAAYAGSGAQNAVGTYTKGQQAQTWGRVMNWAGDQASKSRSPFIQNRAQGFKDAANNILHPPK